MSDDKKWLDPAICAEILRCKRNLIPLTEDNQKLWDSWTWMQQESALSSGRLEIDRRVEEDNGKNPHRTRP